MARRRKRSAPLAKGPKACLHALRSLASFASLSGDIHSALHKPWGHWPAEVREFVADAFSCLAAGNNEVSVGVVKTALEAVRGRPLMPGCRVRLPPADQDPPGSARDAKVMRMRNFQDALIDAAERTLNRDAASSPLAKGKAPLPEQRAMRQYLGIPSGPSASAARVKTADLMAMLQGVGVGVQRELLLRLVAQMAREPAVEDPSGALGSGSAVPYLDAERLLLASLSKSAFKQLLAARPQQALASSRPASRTSSAEDDHVNEWFRAGRVADELTPAPNLSMAELERWWLVGEA